MSLKRAIRNARRAMNYGIGIAPEWNGASFDLTTEEGKANYLRWQENHPQKPPPWEILDGS